MWVCCGVIECEKVSRAWTINKNIYAVSLKGNHRRVLLSSGTCLSTAATVVVL